MNNLRIAWLPNAFSVGRLLAAPLLAWLAFRGMHGAFAALLVPALASDIVDGWLARKLGAVSARGASLDSIADICLVLVMVYAIWPLHPYVYLDHGWVIIAVVVVWILGHTASLLRYGRLASFHTRLIRAGIFAFSIFALVLFLFGFVPWLLYLAAVTCTLGALEHFAMLAMVPDWTPNLHGGIPEALRRRREAGGRRA
jgi:CDP-diacylglycerol--glycerol-3-phosphate 3-phosphatidyltransferase